MKDNLPKWKTMLVFWICAWVGLAEDLLEILSLGLLRTRLRLNVAKWCNFNIYR